MISSLRALSVFAVSSARHCTRSFNPNIHREGAKNAKRAMGELVHFVFTSRSWRLGGERLNLHDLLLARGLVLVRVGLPHVLFRR
jgi:hypothetical protein